eukprot:940642-Pyramimonas_sp.AAC.1
MFASCDAQHRTPPILSDTTPTHPLPERQELHRELVPLAEIGDDEVKEELSEALAKDPEPNVHEPDYDPIYDGTTPAVQTGETSSTWSAAPTTRTSGPSPKAKARIDEGGAAMTRERTDAHSKAQEM